MVAGNYVVIRLFKFLYSMNKKNRMTNARKESEKTQMNYSIILGF